MAHPNHTGDVEGRLRERPLPARSDQPSESELRRLAVRRLRRKRAFRRHLSVYLGVNTAFWLVWIIGGIASRWIFPWPIFPTVFWGLFILGEASDLYWRAPLTEAQVQREIEHLRRTPSRARGLQGFDDEADWWTCEDWSWPPPGFFGRDPRDETRR